MTRACVAAAAGFAGENGQVQWELVVEWLPLRYVSHRPLKLIFSFKAAPQWFDCFPRQGLRFMSHPFARLKIRPAPVLSLV